MSIRWLQRLHVGLVVLIVLLPVSMWFGPPIEGRVRPIRGPVQIVKVIERTPSHLCWAWTFTKLRAIASGNNDSFLVIDGQEGGVTAVFDMESGRPWGLTKFAVPPRTEPYTLHQCIALPPYITAENTVIVKQTAYYPGFLGLWQISVGFPDVVSPGVKAP